MEVKSTGSSKNFNKTMSYLGTETDGTPAHKNPGKAKYYRAKANGDTAKMMYYKPYLKRDQMTFGNIGVNGIKQIEAENRKAIGTKRKVKSHEFVLMPSKSDKIDPHDPDSLLRMKKFTQNFMGYAFQGHFVHPKDSRTKRGKPKYYFERDNDEKPRFQWFADLQVDSHNHARPHVHIVVFNKNLKDNGKAMNANYYGIHHLRDAVNEASADSYTDDPEHVMSSATTHNDKHEPSKIEKKIIESARNIRQNTAITSRPKLIKALAKNGVVAKYRRNKKHPERSGWKFKIPKHSFIKASNLSRCNGGEFLASAKIDKILSDNRKLKAKQRQNAEIKARNQRLDDLAHQHQQFVKRQREAEIQREDKIKRIKHDKKVKKLKQRQAVQRANQRRLNAIDEKAKARDKAKAKKIAKERKIEHDRILRHQQRREREEQSRRVAKIQSAIKKSKSQLKESATPSPTEQQRSKARKPRAKGIFGRFAENVKRFKEAIQDDTAPITRHFSIKALVTKCGRKISVSLEAIGKKFYKIYKDKILKRKRERAEKLRKEKDGDEPPL